MKNLPRLPSRCIVALAMSAAIPSCGSPSGADPSGGRRPASPRAEAALAEARAFIVDHEASVRPLEIALNRAWWDASTSGKDEDFAGKEKAQNDLDAALSARPPSSASSGSARA